MDENHTSDEPRVQTVEATSPPDETMQAFGRVAAAWKRNRPNFPLAKLEKYQGRYIAWNPEVTTIILSAETDEGIEDRIRTAGYDPALCLVEFIP